MDEGVEPVDARGQPGDEEGAEEEEGDARVEPGFGVGFAQGDVAGEGAHAEEVGAGGFAELLLLFVLLEVEVLADFDVDGVRVEVARFDGFRTRDCYCGATVVGIERGFVAGVGCDVDYGGHGAFEGIFIERIEEALELMAVVPDFAKRHGVNDQGE